MSLNKQGGNQAITVTTWTIVKVVLVLLGVALVWYLRDVLAMLFVALLLAALIDPFADWFEKNHIPRGAAVIIIYLCLILAVSLVFVMVIPTLIEQSTQLIQTFGYQGEIDNFLDDLKKATTGAGITDANSIVSVLQSFSATITNFVGGVGTVAIVLVLTFYMVVEEEAVARVFRGVAPQEYQPYLSQLFDRMRAKIGSWLRGQIILGVIIGTIIFIGLTILDVRYALVLALIAGVLEIIPYVGPILSAIPAVVLTFIDSPARGVAVLVLYFVIQQIENNVLVPRVMQKVAGLNPIISIVALVVGLKFGGVAGAIFAIPVAMMASVILQDFFYDESRAFDEE
jgi:predicted PurR-regulated permease PerM